MENRAGGEYHVSGATFFLEVKVSERVFFIVLADNGTSEC